MTDIQAGESVRVIRFDGTYVYGIVTGTNEKDGNPVIDITTYEGDTIWAYAEQVEITR